MKTEAHRSNFSFNSTVDLVKHWKEFCTVVAYYFMNEDIPWNKPLHTCHRQPVTF